MSKKISILLMAVFMFCSPVFGTAADQKITMASASQGGTWYIIGGAFEQILERFISGMQVTTIATPGVTPENMTLLARGEVELGLATNNILYAAYAGKMDKKMAGMFAGDIKEKLNTFRTVMVGAPSHFFLVTRSDSSINSYSDLKGKKVSVMTAGAGTNTEIMKFMPSVFGLQPGKDFKPLYMTNFEAAEAIKDGAADAAFFTARHPVSALMDLDRARKIKFIQMTNTELKKLMEQAPYLAPVDFPKGSYTGMTTDYKTYMLPVSVITTDKVDVDLIYNVTKTLFEHLGDLKAIHPGAADFSDENTIKAHVTPLHKGTEKYFKEKGLL